MRADDLAAAGFSAAIPAHPVVYAEIGGRRVRLMLRIGDRGELERITGRGVQEINSRFAQMMASEAEIAEIIRLGLVGGGECTPVVAAAVVDTYVRPRLFDYFALATHVFLASVAGVDVMPASDGPGEPPAPDPAPGI